MKTRKAWLSVSRSVSIGYFEASSSPAGLNPGEFEKVTIDLLSMLRSSVPAGLRRLRKKTGYFPKSKLRDWLNDLLKVQVKHYTGEEVHEDVTFKQLFDATSIELNIVAADIQVL